MLISFLFLFCYYYYFLLCLFLFLFFVRTHYPNWRPNEAHLNLAFDQPLHGLPSVPSLPCMVRFFTKATKGCALHGHHLEPAPTCTLQLLTSPRRKPGHVVSCSHETSSRLSLLHIQLHATHQNSSAASQPGVPAHLSACSLPRTDPQAARPVSIIAPSEPAERSRYANKHGQLAFLLFPMRLQHCQLAQHVSNDHYQSPATFCANFSLLRPVLSRSTLACFARLVPHP